MSQGQQLVQYGSHIYEVACINRKEAQLNYQIIEEKSN